MVQQGLQVYLIPGQAAYRPGETVTALLQVLATSRQPVEGVELHEVEIECGGVERVDTSWVSADYRRGVPTIKSDKRRHDRSVFQTRLQAATQGDFSDASLRRFVVRWVAGGTPACDSGRRRPHAAGTRLPPAAGWRCPPGCRRPLEGPLPGTPTTSRRRCGTGARAGRGRSAPPWPACQSTSGRQR